MSLEELEKRVQAIEDLEEIKKLHQKYMDLMDNLRYKEVVDLFVDEFALSRSIKSLYVSISRVEVSGNVSANTLNARQTRHARRPVVAQLSRRGSQAQRISG